jgi:hypothetical protein
VNKPWLNAVAAFVVSVLLGMSLILMATTLFTNIDVRVLALVLGLILLVGYLIAGAFTLRSRARRPAPVEHIPTQDRDTWRMPALNLLDRPKWSRGRMTAMYLLRGYLVIAVLLLLVKTVQLGLHK